MEVAYAKRFKAQQVENAKLKSWRHKHGGSKRVAGKTCTGIGEETLEVLAVEVTGSNIGDAHILPEFLDQIQAGEQIGSMTADGACDIRKSHEPIAVSRRRRGRPAKQKSQTEESRGPRCRRGQ